MLKIYLLLSTVLLAAFAFYAIYMGFKFDDYCLYDGGSFVSFAYSDTERCYVRWTLIRDFLFIYGMYALPLQVPFLLWYRRLKRKSAAASKCANLNDQRSL